jgi:hypothetical protein
MWEKLQASTGDVVESGIKQRGDTMVDVIAMTGEEYTNWYVENVRQIHSRVSD